MSAPGDLNQGGAARLIAQLQGEGELDSAGAFTLDRERARQKIQRFQLTNPARYVLELVQAAVLKGAQNLAFAVDFDDFHLRCDGQPFTLADFEHVYAALFLRATERPEQARRHLALGLCTAMALDPAVVRIESGDATGGAFLELRRGVPDRFGAQAHGPHQPPGSRPYTTHVHVRQRLRLQLLKRFFLDRDGQLAEDLLLRKRCQYARVAIWLNGQPVARGPELPQTSQPRPFADGDIQGLVGLRPIELKGSPLSQPRPFYPDVLPTELQLVKNGVWVATVYPEALLPGFQAIADCPTLRQDISHEHVVQDEQYQRVVNAVFHQQIARLAADCGRVMERLAAFSEWTINALRILLMALLQRLGSLANLVPPSHLAATVPEAGSLLDFPLLRSAGEKSVTLRQLLDDTAAHGSLAISAIPSSEPDPQRPIVLYLSEPAEAELLASLLGCQVVDRAATLLQALRRRQNRDAWLRRRMTSTLGNQSCFSRTRIDEPGIYGEIGVSLAAAQEQRSSRRRLAGSSRPTPSEQPESRLLLVREGCLLAEKSILTPVPGLTLIIEADFTPSALFDGVVGDAILSAALTAAFAALVPLLQALTTAPLAPTLERLRARTVRSLVWLLLSGSAQRQVRLMAGVEPRVAEAEPPLSITSSVLWDYLRDWPLLDGLGQGLVSLTQLDTWASEYGCVPVLMLPPAQLGAFRQSPHAAYQYETFRQQYPEPLWPAAHARDPGKARSPKLPKLVVVLSSAEWEFAELLRARLGDRYADMHDWLQLLQPTPAPGALAERYPTRTTALPEPPAPPRNIRNDCWVYVAFAQGAGYLGLCCVPSAQRPLDRTVVELYRGATLWRTLELPLPTGDMLVASVDLTRLPDPSATQPEPEQASEQALAAALTRELGQALPALVTAVLSGQTVPPDERLWLLRLAAALFPTLLFRRAYDRLCEQAALTAAGRGAAEQEYAVLLRLAVTQPLQTIDQALRQQLATPGNGSLSIARLLQELGPPTAANSPQAPADLSAALSWIELVYPQSADVPAGLRVHRPLPQLLHAPMLSSPSGEPLSLLGLFEELRQHGQVLYAPTASGALTWSHKTRKVVAVPDAPTWVALSCLLGEPNLLHVAMVPGAQSRATALPGSQPPEAKAIAQSDAPPAASLPACTATRPARPPPLPAESAPPVLISAAEQLRELVYAELIQLGQTSGRLLSNVNLARLQIGQKKSPVAVLCNADALLINLRHPMIQYAVEHFAQNRALVFFVASAVYTALNDWLVGVTDDEAEFHRLLSARARAQLLPPDPGPGKGP